MTTRASGVNVYCVGVSRILATPPLHSFQTIVLYDFDEQPNRRLVGLIKETGKAEKIPLQFDLVNGYGDDSSAIQASNGGVPTVNIVVPVRYTHAHNGVMDRNDFDRTVDLVVALIKRLDSGTVKRLRDFTP